MQGRFAPLQLPQCPTGIFQRTVYPLHHVGVPRNEPGGLHRVGRNGFGRRTVGTRTACGRNTCGRSTRAGARGARSVPIRMRRFSGRRRTGERFRRTDRTGGIRTDVSCKEGTVGSGTCRGGGSCRPPTLHSGSAASPLLRSGINGGGRAVRPTRCGYRRRPVIGRCPVCRCETGRSAAGPSLRRNAGYFVKAHGGIQTVVKNPAAGAQTAEDGEGSDGPQEPMSAGAAKFQGFVPLRIEQFVERRVHRKTLLPQDADPSDRKRFLRAYCASQRPQISAARPSSHPAARATAAASEVPTGWEVNSTMRQGGTILRDDIRRAPYRTMRSDPAPGMQTAPSAISRLATILSTSRIMGLAFIVSNIWFYVVRIRSRPRPPSSAAMRSPQRQGVSAPAGSYRRPAR